MEALTFKRGVHPPDGKSLACDKPIEKIMPKENSELFYPMSQHIGAPCDPIVQVGDYVKVGQKIAESAAFMSSPIFASVSGTVKDIRPVLVPGGAMVKAIVVENDGKMEVAEGVGEKRDYTKMSKEEIIAAIKAGGVVGLGGAGFPTHVKLSPKDAHIDYIIVNGAECEPYLTCDYRLMLEQSEKIVKGLQIILSLFPEAKGVIGIEDNKPKAIEVMTKACEGIDNISVATLRVKFPQGSEKHLIYAVTGREVLSGKLPADAGCIVDNVDTVIAIEKAVCENTPIVRRIVTVTGNAVKNPGNYEIRVGMTFKDLVDAIGGFKEEPGKIIAGGPMMGPSLYTLDVSTVKASSGLLCLTKSEAVLPEESNCIRCGRCVEHCPMGLMPFQLNASSLRDDSDSFLKDHGLDCIACGCCSYICPAKRMLAQSISSYKKILAGRRKK
ncbi:MAG: electron transport complex subunit RsxC [Clostridiales bacterium]|nr:electron transport complex subunit RsxC [Clostridiales bacterium]